MRQSRKSRICYIALHCSGILVDGVILTNDPEALTTLPVPAKSLGPVNDQGSTYQGHTLLNMTLCLRKCETDCKSYITPTGVCYSSGALFPNDPSWSDEWDIWDDLIDDVTLHRTIFRTKNNTCYGNDTDYFEIPLGVCVGPFGKPRPWGFFQVVSDPPSFEVSNRGSATDDLSID